MTVRRRIAITLVACLLGFSGAHGARGQDGALRASEQDEALPLDPIARLAALDERIDASLSDARTAENERARVDAELRALAGGREAANRRLHARVRALYRVTRAGALPLAGGFDALLSHLGRVERLERIVRHDAESLAELRSRAEALRAETERLAARIERARGRVAELESAKRATEEEAHRAVVYAAAFGEGLGSPPPASGGFGIRVVGPQPAPVGFEAQRGRITLPLAAPRSVRDARREDGAGVELDGARGDAVRVAARGRVAFSDRHPSYGRLVIVDHGEGWFSVYGGLARLEAEIGDELTPGTRLGTVDGEPLFFQIRRGTRAMDARAWLGL